MVLQVLDQVHRGLEVDDWTFKKTFVFDNVNSIKSKKQDKTWLETFGAYVGVETTRL